jgi:hypothetical protein
LHYTTAIVLAVVALGIQGTASPTRNYVIVGYILDSLVLERFDRVLHYANLVGIEFELRFHVVVI